MKKKLIKALCFVFALSMMTTMTIGCVGPDNEESIGESTTESTSESTSANSETTSNEESTSTEGTTDKKEEEEEKPVKNETFGVSEKSYEELKKLDGKEISVIGYMANITPTEKDFIYLMDIPFQSDPFYGTEDKNTVNTIPVYAIKGETIEHAEGVIKVTGVLEFGEFDDSIGFTYDYRIKDATCEALYQLDIDGVDDMLWLKAVSAKTVYRMSGIFNYLTFMCKWPTARSGFVTNEDGGRTLVYYTPETAQERMSTFYIRPHTEETYFKDLAEMIKKLDGDCFDELAEIIEDAKKLADKANEALVNKEYTYNEETKQYTLNKGEEFSKELDDLIDRYNEWIAQWRL